MGLFDRIRKRDKPRSPPPTGRTEVVVPDGHRVDRHGLSQFPCVGSCAGGIWLADLGLGSDEQDADVDTILREAEALAQGPRPQVLLAREGGTLSSLFAPSSPAIDSRPGLLVWVLDAASLYGAPHASVLVQRVMRCLHQLRTHSTPPLAQVVFLRQGTLERDGARAKLILGLGIEVRMTDPDDACVVVVVHRPDGVILSGLVGTSYEPADPIDSYGQTVNQQKDRAEIEGDYERLERLEAQERGELDMRLAPVGDEPRVLAVWRAPRLCRLLVSVSERNSDAHRQSLYKELVGREIPLLVFADPKTRGAPLTTWPNGLKAMAVYPDRASLFRSAHDLGMAPGSIAAVELPPKKLFAWAANHGFAVAMNVFREPDEPLYVPLAPDVVCLLARGEVPPPRSTEG